MTTDEQGACKSCGAAIRFAITVNGKKIPLNFLPDPKGNIRLQDGLKAFYLKKDDQYDGERYMPHHATCPNAAEYRKTKDPSLKIEDVYAEPKQVPDPKPAVVDRTGGN